MFLVIVFLPTAEDHLMIAFLKREMQSRYANAENDMICNFKKSKNYQKIENFWQNFKKSKNFEKLSKNRKNLKNYQKKSKIFEKLSKNRKFLRSPYDCLFKTRNAIKIFECRKWYDLQFQKIENLKKSNIFEKYACWHISAVSISFKGWENIILSLL